MSRLATSLAALAVLLTATACDHVSVGADNKYGQTRAVGMVGVSLDAVADQVKAATTRRPSDFEGPVSGRVVSVHDGNTLTVLIGGRTEKVRLIGVDAPELAHVPWGEHARGVLKALVEGKPVRLDMDITARDRDKRLLAYIHVGETFVNLEMIRQGRAVLRVEPPNVAHVEEYRTAQAEARDAGRGVWDRTQPLDVMPDCYRKLKAGQAC